LYRSQKYGFLYPFTMIYRSAFIGLLLGLVIAALLLFVPENRNFLFRPQESSDLPPTLFPMFPEEGESSTLRLPAEPLIKIERTPVQKEIAPGSSMRFVISVKNVSEVELTNLIIEERFDDALLSVKNVEEGTLSHNLIIWKIPTLGPGERKSGNYLLTVLPTTPVQALEVTAFVRGEEVLEETLSSSRMATSVLNIVQLPKTGIDLR